MPRYHLSVGFHGTRALRVVAVAVLGSMAAGAAACAGTLLGLVGIDVLAPGDPSGPERWGFLPIVLAVLFPGAIVLYSAFLIARVVRMDAWLEGTRLTVRVFREQTVDLAHATAVALQLANRRLIGPVRRTGVIGPAPRAARLVVTSHSQKVRLWLATPDAVQLPPDQLLALANALSLARCPGAAEIVTWLRGAAQASADGLASGRRMGER